MSNKETTVPARWYKVLIDGKSFIHPTNYAWSLPVLVEGSRAKFIPGDWHQVEGEIEVCHYGLHLTSEPAQWVAMGATVYLAEFDDPEALLIEYAVARHREDKIAVRKARLIRPLTEEELPDVQIFLTGKGEVSSGHSYVAGEALVKASGDSCVKAVEKAKIYACDNAQVKARDYTEVDAWGDVRVDAFGNTRVTAGGRANINAFAGATVKANGYATVSGGEFVEIHASGQTRISAWDNAVVRADGYATVYVSGRAILTASDNANIMAQGKSKVKASGNVVVRAYGEAMVEADEHATVISMEGHSITPVIKGQAVWINTSQREEPPGIVVGGVEYAPVPAPAIEK